MDITQRSHDLITRLERKHTMKVAQQNSRRHALTLIRDNEFNFPRITRHLRVIG